MSISLICLLHWAPLLTSCPEYKQAQSSTQSPLISSPHILSETTLKGFACICCPIADCPTDISVLSLYFGFYFAESLPVRHHQVDDPPLPQMHGVSLDQGPNQILFLFCLTFIFLWICHPYQWIVGKKKKKLIVTTKYVIPQWEGSLNRKRTLGESWENPNKVWTALIMS